jgi:hypothetical protein
MPRLSKIGAAALAAFGFTGSTGAAAVSASYLVVAGGGGGGCSQGGGGGAGGYLTSTLSLTVGVQYTITVGAGGAGSSGAAIGSSGSNSVLSGTGITTVTSNGGGGGATSDAGSGLINGASGGSGGGGASTGSTSGTGGTATSGQGNAGGNGSTDGLTYRNGGGGGGASAVGVAGSAVGPTPGNGGNGTASSISGSSVSYAGGGGGGGGTNRSSGGTGGGGAGGINGGASPVNGTANTGGGGGGGLAPLGSGASGGSGIVIISYTGAQQFGGGIVTSSGGNTIHTFLTSGTLSPLTSLSASYLIVAGGGGGSNNAGGGAGGMLTGSSLTIDTNSTYLVTVGAGGSQTANGSNSYFGAVSTTAIGGGGLQTGTGGRVGGSGGSGGGASYSAANGGVVGSATAGQGNAGGIGGDGVTNFTSGGGGGGAGAAGSGTANANGGNGGVGLTSSISGTSTYYAGGGGGGSTNTATAGTGGLGGGGNGAAPGTASSGTANTGGGGGGGNTSGSGGSGIVIISYAGATQQMAGGSVTITGGNVIHTFTSSGYLTPLTYYSNSLRFRSSASAYLSRTFGTPTNNQKWTWSAWIKRGSLASANYTLLRAPGSSPSNGIRFETNASLRIFFNDGSSGDLQTTALYRDPAAWYHIVIAIDTTQATSSNRVLMYVNGSQVTSFATSSYPAQNYNPQINSAVLTQIGGYYNGGTLAEFFDGYQSNINFIDGQQLTPNSFGTVNSYGVWQPINYGGSYGTNGFYLPFTNTASTTTLGYDFSPQGNNWTANNISLTAGSTYDSMTDVPTLTSTTAANYAVMNPLQLGPNLNLSNGNLTATKASSTTDDTLSSTIFALAASSGKYYAEITLSALGSGTYYLVGVTNGGISQNSGGQNIYFPASFYSSGNGYKGQATSTAPYAGAVAYGSTWGVGDVIGIAIDTGTGNLTFYKNGTSQGIAFTSLGYSQYGFYGNFINSSSTGTANWNFGQQPFVYTPPSTYVALNTYNL